MTVAAAVILRQVNGEERRINNLGWSTEMGENQKQKTTAVHSLETVRRVRGIVKEMNARAHQAKLEGIPVAYCMVASQYDEIIKAMGIVAVWTENWAGLCAAKRDAERFLLKAETEGYPANLCGYTRTGIGFDAMRYEQGRIPEGAADGGMPIPDLLLGSSAMCDPRFKWYQALGRYLDIPIYNIDVLWPKVGVNLTEVRDYYTKYQRQEFDALVRFLEKHTGKKMDYEVLDEIIDISDQTYLRWWESYQLRKAKPCPMASEDHFNAFVPAFFLLGERKTLDFYNDLYNEIKERVQRGVGVLQDEKHRLLWCGLPPWHSLWMFNYFQTLGAVFTIEGVWDYRPWDPVEIPSNVRHPLDKLAYQTFMRFTNRYDKAKRNSGNADVELLLDLVNDYSIDGMVMHASMSCRATTIGQIHLRNIIQQYLKIPCLFLASDIVDIRDYSESEWKRRIDAFMEAVLKERQQD